jgi:hypothetical protein
MRLRTIKPAYSSAYQVQVADFAVIVDGERVGVVEATGRADAWQLAAERFPYISTLPYQGRVALPVLEHECQSSAGNTSVCVFCQGPVEL